MYFACFNLFNCYHNRSEKQRHGDIILLKVTLVENSVSVTLVPLAQYSVLWLSWISVSHYSLPLLYVD